MEPHHRKGGKSEETEVMMELYNDLRELDELSRQERRKVYKKLLKWGRIYTIFGVIVLLGVCFVVWLRILRPVLAVSLALNILGINMFLFPYWLYNKFKRWDTPGNRYLTKIFSAIMFLLEMGSVITMLKGVSHIWSSM